LSRSQVLAALRDESLIGPTIEDYRGDLQMHSTWSDGEQTLEEIIEGGIEREYEFCGITDHSYGLPIAGGLSMEKLAQQHAEIDRLNRKYKGRFRLIKGIEANIRADGSVDMTADERATLELVVAAPHSVLRSPSDQTARMIARCRDSWRSHPRPPAWAHLWFASRRQRALERGLRCRGTIRRRR
jgi:histidinol phosphatase-like PHP family hydrolase